MGLASRPATLPSDRLISNVHARSISQSEWLGLICRREFECEVEIREATPVEKMQSFMLWTIARMTPCLWCSNARLWPQSSGESFLIHGVTK